MEGGISYHFCITRTRGRILDFGMGERGREQREQEHDRKGEEEGEGGVYAYPYDDSQ